MNVRDLVNSLLEFDPTQEIVCVNINADDDVEEFELDQVVETDEGLVSIQYAGLTPSEEENVA